MSTTRVMPGVANMEGQTVNTLKVGEMVSRNPRPRYNTTCQRCGARSTEGQDRLVNGAARCRSLSCGKSVQPTGRDLVREQRRIAAEREAEQATADREASAARMEAETADWERPERYAPTPSKHTVMSERERMELRAFKEAEEAAERERLRPIREAEQRAAEEQAKREQRESDRKAKQAAYWKEAVETGPDPKLFVSPELATAEMKKSEAESHNLEQVNKFISTTPEYSEFKSPDNAEKIIAYLSKNGVNIFDVPTLKAAFHRLRDLGIVTPRPAPEPPPAMTPAPKRTTAPKPINPKDEIVDGWELDGSAPRKWTQRELDRLSATDYRRALRIYKDALQLTQLSPLAR